MEHRLTALKTKPGLNSFVGCLVTFLTVAVCATTPVSAFDTGPHFDLTRDALSAEGFGDTAIGVAQVTNWMVDFYEQASQNPYSGHSAWWKELIGGAIGYREHWSETVISSADWLHFDTTPKFVAGGLQRGLDSPETISMEWDRFTLATRQAVRDCVRTGDVQGLLIVIGITTHAVQDFYAHTNWVERAGRADTSGFEGPGWAARSIYGSHPTWFDIPDDARRSSNVHAGVGGVLRGHGHWNGDGNRNLRTSINKDWPGRPLYQDAYITSYFATRQWVNAVHRWVNNESIWRAAQQYNDRRGLDRDLQGAWEISFNAGHWQGQGEPTGADAPGPGGSLDDLIRVLGNYHRAGKSGIRSKFEQMVVKIANKNPQAAEVHIEPSVAYQTPFNFICLKVTKVRDATPTGMVGIDVGADQADFYARATIAGQKFSSGMLHGRDNFDFGLPNYPFTFIKAVSKLWRQPEPVTTLRVLVRTCDAMWAGTDDNVYLRVSDTTRFHLDKPLYNDFERGDEDTYTIEPPAGMKVSDIRYIQIEKSKDGTAGGWKLSRVGLDVNGRRVYYKDRIDKWLEKSSLTWRAPDFRPSSPETSGVPIVLELWDSDGMLYGDDDHCDINPDYGRRNLNMLFNMNTGAISGGDIVATGSAASTGGSRHGGRGIDDDTCEIRFSIQKVAAVVPTVVPGTAVGGIRATLTANPAEHRGAFPAAITFTGKITTDRACDVRYQFIRSDGGSTSVQSVRFDSAGTKEVTMTWTLTKAYNGWVNLKLLSPGGIESGRAEFSVLGPVITPKKVPGGLQRL